MRLLEYEAKRILRRYQIDTPEGHLVSLHESWGHSFPVMLKVQIPLGGRGKTGGVVEVADASELSGLIGEMLDANVRGYQVKKILIEEKIDVKQEFFMAVTYDTVAKSPVAIFSAVGGVDIELLSAKNPDRVKKAFFTTRFGLLQYRAREILAEAEISDKLMLSLGAVFSKLAHVFLASDATLVEVNPLALTAHGKLVALDCHLEIDDDALFRQPPNLFDHHEERFVDLGRRQSDFERKAAEIDAQDHRGVAGRVIEFDGNLGLIIGGGGASLTAFDAIRQYGGKPANYCEIGGNPSVRKVQELTQHILSKKGIRKIAVIMNVVSNTRVDLVARGVIKGILESGRDPAETLTVFRVPGAWEEEGIKILSNYHVPFSGRAVSIDEAARIAVEKTKALTA
jgi:succinyl-CoA synthetase beta subunit